MASHGELYARRSQAHRNVSTSPLISDMMAVRAEMPKASLIYALLLAYLRRAGDDGAHLADLARAITGDPNNSSINQAARRLVDMGLIESSEKRSRCGGYWLRICDVDHGS